MKNLDLIWNISLICPWNCAFCCTDAVNVNKSKHSINIHENKQLRCIPDLKIMNGSSIDLLKKSGVQPSIYDIALQDRQNRSLELTYKEKIKILTNIDLPEVKIDFGGGDPLACYENFMVICEAAKLFGKKNISVTTTGISLKRYDIHEIKKYIGKIEFTYDELENNLSGDRPKSYNQLNLLSIPEIAQAGIKTRAQIPIHKGNSTQKIIRKIYTNLHNNSVDELLLMRLFPVGRGQNLDNKYLFEKEKYLDVIKYYKLLEQEFSKPRVKIQCAFKYLFNDCTVNPCDALNPSFGINPMGKLLLCAWANGYECKPLDESFVMHDLNKHKISTMLEDKKFIRYTAKRDNNFGHCKVFSFLYSPYPTSDALFSTTDPLFCN